MTRLTWEEQRLHLPRPREDLDPDLRWLQHLPYPVSDGALDAPDDWVF